MASEWDDIDAWADERRQKALPIVLSGECPITGERTSPGTARKLQAEARIARGFHPFGLRLRQSLGESCGSCSHLLRRGGARNTFFKCELRGVTRGPATDVRKKWPACASWEASNG